MLTEAQQGALLRLARGSVAAGVLHSSQPPFDPPAEFPAASGVFVTLKRRGELRGCLGTLQCVSGVAAEVARCARDSATADPRFPPVARDELGEITIEISVLGPLEPVDPRRADAFIVGVHGLVVEQGGGRGLLLPQVATEWGWTADQFLRQTCRKAGLPDDAWQHGARVFRFTAEVFGQ